MKYDYRNKTYKDSAQVFCPEHGWQRTYDLFRLGKIKAIGCWRCFHHLPGKIVTEDMYRCRKR